jgi:N-methylhydantoinase B
MASHLPATSPSAAMRDPDRDPFTLEVIKSFLLAVGDEMFAAQQRTSMSPIVYEVLDFAAGMTDARGNMIT